MHCLQKNGVLTAELDTLEDARYPKEARAPEGGQVGPVLCQDAAAVGMDHAGEGQDRVQHEPNATQEIKGGYPPANAVEGRSYPRSRGFRHGCQSKVYKANTGDYLEGGRGV